MKSLIRNLLSKNNFLNKMFYKVYYLYKKMYLNIFVGFKSCKINEFENGGGYSNILENYSPRPLSKTYITENKIISEEYDLQIIIPAYNVEKYIEECVDSILNQKTNYKILVIIINDGSTDNTEDLLKKYSNISNIRIISQKNGGLSDARNKGLKNIFAKYVMFLDSDDILLEDSIENLLSFGFKNNLDIVEGGYYSYINADLIGGRNHVDSLNGNQLFGFAWGKIIKNKIFENLCFPEKYYYEDSIFAYLIYPQNFKCGTIKEYVYGYRVNPNSITNSKKFTKKHLETWYITEELLINGIEYYDIELTEKLYNQYLRQIKLNYKRTLIYPEEIKKAIFFGSKKLLGDRFKSFLKNSKGIDKKLVKSLLENDYGKYCFICKYSN